MNKKGSNFIGGIIFIIVAILVVFFFVIMMYAANEVRDNLRPELEKHSENASVLNYTKTFDRTLGNVNVAYNTLPWLAVFLILGMIIAIFIGSFAVTTKPVYFVPYIIFSFVTIFIGIGVSNGYEKVMANASLSATFDQFSLANFFMLRLPYIVTVTAIVGGIIMYSAIKGRQYV